MADDRDEVVKENIRAASEQVLRTGMTRRRRGTFEVKESTVRMSSRERRNSVQSAESIESIAAMIDQFCDENLPRTNSN